MCGCFSGHIYKQLQNKDSQCVYIFLIRSTISLPFCVSCLVCEFQQLYRQDFKDTKK